jgi:hypothetical protein
MVRLREEILGAAGDLRDFQTVGVDTSLSLVDRFRLLGDEFTAALSLMSAVSGYLSQTYQRNVAEETAALEASGMAREDAVARAEENNEALRVNQKRLASAGVVFNTASAIMRAFSDLGPIAGPIAAAGIAITGAAQLAAINAEQPAGGGRSGRRGPTGGSSSSGGSSGPGYSSASAGLAVGSGAASQNRGATVVNVPRPVFEVLPEARITPEGLYFTVKVGEQRVARGRGRSGGLNP